MYNFPRGTNSRKKYNNKPSKYKYSSIAQVPTLYGLTSPSSSVGRRSAVIFCNGTFKFQVVAPTLENPACQQQLMAAVKEVATAVEGLVTMCNETCTDDNLNRDLSKAAAEVTKTLNQLLNHIKVVKLSPG